MTKLLLTTLILCLTQCATSQSDKYQVSEQLSKSVYLEDFDQLVDSIRTHHPQPYEFVSKEGFDQFIDHSRSNISDATSAGEFSWLCNAVTAKVGCVHSSASGYNILDFSGQMFFPVHIAYVGSKLYILESYRPNPELKQGTEILKINGVDVLELKEQMSAHISSDGYIKGFTDAVINKSFSYFCINQLNFPENYRVEIEDNGVKKEVEIKRHQPDAANNASKTPPKNLDFTLNESENLAKVSIRSFVYYDDQLRVFTSFIDSCFNQIHLNEIENVVIDLRGNGGGDPYCAAHLLKYISKEPFRYYKQGTDEYYQDLEEEIIPFKNNFKGKVFILLNSLCASTTGHLSSILKHYDIGILIGSETGATYSCNANTINFQLKHTGINCLVATQTYQTAVTGFEKNRGIIPDYEISRTLSSILNEKDLEMEMVRELIGNE